MGVEVRLLDSFADVDRASWDSLLDGSPTNTQFSTWQWQEAWWASLGRGDLVIAVALASGTPVLAAPLFIDGGMGFFGASGSSDYLDFLGRVEDEVAMSEMLSRVADEIHGFIGFRFHHIPDASPSGRTLAASARRLGLDCVVEDELGAPFMDIAADPDVAAAAIRKKSLRRAERYFTREGELEVQHFRAAAEILPHLDAFFDQHVGRWAATPFPSLFNDAAHRDLYRRLAALQPAWLRFTRVAWEGTPIAFHYGFSYRGSFMWYKPSFDIELARRSPGEVLMRQLLIEALREGSTEFDLGLGDEAFKARFATGRRTMRTWGLYAGSGS